MDQPAVFNWDGPKTWDDPESDPIEDIAQAVKLFREATGMYPDSMHMSPKVREALTERYS